jgi:hypothetical protein
MILSIFEEQGFVYPASAVQYRGRKQSGGEALLGLAASNWLVGRGEFCSSLRINSKAWQWDPARGLRGPAIEAIDEGTGRGDQ